MKLVLPSDELLEASNYRSFLQALYLTNKALDPQFSYSYIAKQCKFSSKSYIKEVIDGKKRLSLESGYKLTVGLKFPALWQKYFINLVVLDEKIATKASLEVPREIARLRKKLNTSRYFSIKESESDLFKDMNWPYVYAALGTAEEGATLLEIETRTGLSSEVIGNTLEMLIARHMVAKKGRRFLPSSDTAFYENLGKSIFFKNFYRNSVNKLYEHSRKYFGADDALFYSIALSVNPFDMPGFKKDLAELLDKYSSEVECPEGAKIALLTCGFHLI